MTILIAATSRFTISSKRIELHVGSTMQVRGSWQLVRAGALAMGNGDTGHSFSGEDDGVLQRATLFCHRHIEAMAPSAPGLENTVKPKTGP